MLEKELKESKYYDYFIVNDNLNQAIRDVQTIVYSHKFKKNFC